MMPEVGIEIAADRKTGFPCVRREGAAAFVGLLPITKLQADQWTYEEAQLEDGDDLLQRLEPVRFPVAGTRGSVYPEKTQNLLRVRPEQCTRQNLVSVLATDLTIWSSDDEVEGVEGPGNRSFPTPASEWGRLLRWMRAQAPSENEWIAAAGVNEAGFGQVPTRQLLHEVLERLRQVLSVYVQGLLTKVYEHVSDADRGLPFMNRGLYELVADARRYDRRAGDRRRSLRPLVAGESDVWPVIEAVGQGHTRSVRQRHLPAVTLRPWFRAETALKPESRQHLTTSLRREMSQRHLLLPSTATPAAPPLGIRRLPSRRERRQSVRLCPFCFSEIAENVFARDPIWCWSEGAGEGRVMKHGNAPPPQGHTEALDTRDYLRIARSDPDRVRVVTLSGYSKSGKSTLLAASALLLTYPEGKCHLFSALPAALCAEIGPLGVNRGGQGPSLEALLEEMVVDGDVPERTHPDMPILRAPYFFGSKNQSTLLGRLLGRRQELVVVINDIAGEIVDKPDQLARDGKLTHLTYTTDVVFLVPADRYASALQDLHAFAAGLGAKADGTGADAIPVDRINLVFALSQVDRLKYARREGREIFDIVVQGRYTLPKDHNQSEWQEYVDGMRAADRGLHAWLRESVPQLVTEAERFRSARYCGLSSFGFEPIQEGRKRGRDACLPFEPQPVRAVDPLLWILLEQGVLPGL